MRHAALSSDLFPDLASNLSGAGGLAWANRAGLFAEAHLIGLEWVDGVEQVN